MSTELTLSDAVLGSSRFVEHLARAASQQVARELLGTGGTSTAPDWSYLLSCASALSLSEDQGALDAALRIVQSALTAPDAQASHKAAAVLLLDRMGNQPAIDVARRKHGLAVEELSDYPVALRLDVVRSRLELVVPTRDGPSMPVSRFQRAMWTALNTVQWISASAPTSAGKSRIIRMWFQDVLDRAAREGHAVRLAVIVPSRALVDEVSADLRDDLPFGVQVTTLPWDARAGQAPAEVFVMTQERMHLLQQRFPELVFEVLFVDEAHKLADGSRGVLLQQVTDEAVRRNSSTQVIFASPLAEDPEVLLDAAPTAAEKTAVNSLAATVTQNLLYANQIYRKPQQWTLDQFLEGREMRVVEFLLPASPRPSAKRLPLVAVALAGRGGGNVVYVNNPSDAESTAQVIHDALGVEADLTGDPEVAALIDLVERTINPRYALAAVLRRGVAFHYGNMPQLVRAAVEALFKADKIKYLVCTSTLVEGVNLPCRNLFVRGPNRGVNKPMNAADFWNLAGRAGRWGMELAGNIICVDTTEEGRWKEIPRVRGRQRLRRETQTVFNDAHGLAIWIANGARFDPEKESMEAVFSFLASRTVDGVPLAELPALGASPAEIAVVQHAVETSLTHVTFPRSLIARHAGINPLGMERLLRRMEAFEPEELLIDDPQVQDSYKSYAAAFALLVEVLGVNFGTVPARHNQLAVLVVRWMQGQPLAVLIDSRLSWEARKTTGKQVPPPTTIRNVMRDVESVARFLAPKYLACYLDLTKVHFQRIGRPDLVDAVPQGLEMYLELGVSSVTELSLMALGLSRTTAIELYGLITSDDLDPDAARHWILDNRAVIEGLPVLVVREIVDVLRIADAAS